MGSVCVRRTIFELLHIWLTVMVGDYRECDSETTDVDVSDNLLLEEKPEMIHCPGKHHLALILTGDF